MRSFPLSITTAEILAKAKARNLPLSKQLVYVVRADMKKGHAAPAKSAPLAGLPQSSPAMKRGNQTHIRSSVSVADVESKFRAAAGALILAKGIDRAIALIEQVGARVTAAVHSLRSGNCP